MSGPEPADENARMVTLEEDGVRIEKSLALEEFDTPAIVFAITADRESTTHVKVTDPLPADIEPDDVGLHPEYDSEGWRRRGGDLQFERRLDPAEQVETVYGLRVPGVDDPDALLAEPTVDEVVPVGEGTDADATTDANGETPTPAGEDTGTDADDESSTPTDDDAETPQSPGEGGESPTSTGEDADDDAETDEDADDAGVDIDLTETDDGVVTVAGSGESETDAETEPGDVAVDAGSEESETGAETEPGDAAVDAGTGLADANSVAAALATELEHGEVDDDTREVLAEQLQPSLPPAAETRLDRIQARLDELDAYTDALQRVLDRVGDDDDVVAEIESFRGRVDAVESTAEELSADVEYNDTRLESVDEDVEELRATLEETRADLAAAREDLEADVEALRADLSDDLASEVEDLREEIAEIQEWRNALANTLAGGD